MRKRALARLGWLVVVGIAVSAVVAAISFASQGPAHVNAAKGGPPFPTPPTQTGAPAGTLKLGDGPAFPILSSQWGAGIGVSNSDPPQVSAPSLSEFVVSRKTDATSVSLINAVTQGTQFPTAVLTLSWGSGTTFVYTLTRVYVSGFSQSTGGGQPGESISLNFRNLSWTFTDASGSTSGSYSP